jgi:hypothetical protein
MRVAAATTACALALAALQAAAQVEPIAFPRSYVAYQLQPGENITIDGRLDEPAWEAVAWSEDFVDISGPLVPAPDFATRMKMRYDATYLYVGGYLQETQVWANQTAENSVVFYDNDFEVFISPDGSNGYYKELEVNAINTRYSNSLCAGRMRTWCARVHRRGPPSNATRRRP